MTSPAAGWYPDPAGKADLRYWNGSAWTGHVSPPPAPEPTPAPPIVTPEAPPPAAPIGSPGEPAPNPSADLAATPLARPDLTSVPPPAPGSAAPPAPGFGASGGGAPTLGPHGVALASWGRRAGGAVADMVLALVTASVLLPVVGLATGGFGQVVNREAWDEVYAKAMANPGYQPTEAEVQQIVGPDFLVPLYWWLGLVLLVWFVNGVVLVALQGRTLGQRLAGLRVVTGTGSRPAAGAALVRWALPALLFVAGFFTCFLTWIPWIMDELWPLWDQRRQTLHDKAARTVVEEVRRTEPVNR